MTERFFEKARHSHLVGTLFVIAYFLLMFGNGMISLTHPDEVFYIQSAKEMLAYNSWLTPMIFDQPQFEKPVFTYWLLMIAIKFFGLSPFVARFWPASFGIIGVIATYAIAWLLSHNKRTAFLSGLVLCTSFIYLALSRAVLTDMVFSVWVTITILCFVWAYYRPQYKNIGLFLFFTVMGIAVLTKGILGVDFTLVPVAAFLIYKRDVKFLWAPGTLIGIIAFLAIAVPWHWIMFKWYGSAFIDEYWHNVHVRRIFDAEHPKSDKWYFYIGLMFAGIMPWSFWLIPTLKNVYQSFVKFSKEREAFVFILFWILGVYMFVQPAHSKLASYIFPVFPAQAILIGYYLNKILEKKNTRPITMMGMLWAVLMFAGSIAAVFFAKKYSGFVPDPRPVYILSALCLCCSVVLLWLSRAKNSFGIITANACVTAVVLTVLFFGGPFAEPWVSCRDIAVEFKNIPQDESSVVLTSKFYARGVRYYTDRKIAVIDINGKGFFSPHPIPFLNTPEKVMDFLIQQPMTYAILKKGDVERLTEVTAGQYLIESVGEGIGGKYIIRIVKI